MREKRYKWVLIASYDHCAYRRGDVISKHTAYELAHAALKRSGHETMREIRNVDEIETGKRC